MSRDIRKETSVQPAPLEEWNGIAVGIVENGGFAAFGFADSVPGAGLVLSVHR